MWGTWSGYQLNLSAESSMSFPGLVALKLSFCEYIIASECFFPFEGSLNAGFRRTTG